MPNIISLLCPSRGRPNVLERMIKSAVDTAANPSRVEILIYIDDDDPDRFSYLSSHKNLVSNKEIGDLLNIDLVVGQTLRTPLLNNILAERARGNILMITNDDQIFIDRGWDTRLDEETKNFPDEIYCMWFDDGRYQDTLCTFPILSRKWVETLGYIEPLLFEHFNCDLWTWQIAKIINRTHYISDIRVHHLHPDTGKSKPDNTTERNLRGEKPQIDKVIFSKFERYRILDASLLQDAIDEYDTAK